MRGFSSEENVQILVALLKRHGIRYIIASPGSTNICFVASLQADPFFQIFSAVDERSAAYMACGIAAESGEPVVISCTGATASRNYMPGLTEAFYRHLPILAVTSMQSVERIGQNIPQVLDRSNPPKDLVKKSIRLPFVTDHESRESCITKVNDAIIELTRDEGGPVHIDLPTKYSRDFTISELPNVRSINRYRISDLDYMPKIEYEKVAIFIGEHRVFDKDTTRAIEHFCYKYNAVVLCDHTSNYHGKYKIIPGLILEQKYYNSDLGSIDLLIHIGGISAGYYPLSPKEVWRVSIDGAIKDTFRKMTAIFECEEKQFFNLYADKETGRENNVYYDQWNKACELVSDAAQKAELPLSNAYCAQKMSSIISDNSVVHFGILNSYRVWNLFSLPETVSGFCNVGGFGIDGCVSTAIGASLVDRERTYYCIVGDLAMLYDLNSLTNRHLGNNLRVLVINNGRGAEFSNSISWASSIEADISPFICADGHNSALKGLCEGLGIGYYSALNKEEFTEKIRYFINPELSDLPLVFEVFVEPKDESEAIEILYSLISDKEGDIKRFAKKMLGEEGVRKVNKILKRNV